MDVSKEGERERERLCKMAWLPQMRGSLGFKKNSYGASSLDTDLFHPLFPPALQVGQPSVLRFRTAVVPWPWRQHSTEPVKQTWSIVVVVKCSIADKRGKEIVDVATRRGHIHQRQVHLMEPAEEAVVGWKTELG
jgi:hypothetical protein